MNVAELLTDAFGRVHGVVHDVVEGLTPDQLAHRVDGRSNSIAWLVWHLTRVQDDHVSEVAGRPQAWTGQGWAERFGLPFDESDTGYGHSPREAGQVNADADLLTGYHDAVHKQTVEFVRGLTGKDLERVVDTSWDPPVTLGVRLVSVIDDDMQHAGQAAFLRGLLTG